eukprot:Plantae.Rhodophyta-Purpureofilum_apyrenoidigerum.ctg28242.p1 GENE.Plantae.Rhodophyta-Purpureofilum_apyrenoidigerum.ctg28242~~Plantae.Rhodophyta-Purpureofilum_apyrenoidigerum.ctg28242.p1  ORF type:complete len:116 (+),score=13.95 Plantae.Rhodophyta-Purpureofilum_apyrenoidigerum.ctg28242:114-461(+)
MALSLNLDRKRNGSTSSLVTNSSSSLSSDCSRTRAHGLLNDYDVVSFLASVDLQIRWRRRWLDASQKGRLQALYMQASTDECEELTDIVEFIEEQNLKLISTLTLGAPSSLPSRV